MAIDLLSPLHLAGKKRVSGRLREFVHLLTAAPDERRSEERVPCVRQLTIYRAEEMDPIPAVMGDLSESGIGLVHDVPLTPGKFTLRVPMDDGRVVCARVKLTWCRPMMRHLYTSGGLLLDVFVGDPLSRDPEPKFV